jgi:hypothetical protein
VNALSLFGDDQSAQNMYNLKSYIETLTAHSMMAVKLVTRLTFDERSSVPKLFFSPIRMLTPVEWEQSKVRMQEESIQLMLSDVINEVETGEVKPEAVRTAAPAAPAPASEAKPEPVRQAAPAPTAASVAPQMPALPRPRGRPAKAPEAAAPPAAAPTNGNGATEAVPARGFAAAAAAPAPAAATEGAGKSKGFTIDLDDFDA